VCTALYGKPIEELPSVICHMGSQSHSVTSHLTQVNTPALIPAKHAGTQFTYPRGIECWVDLGDGYIPRWLQTVTHSSRLEWRNLHVKC